MSTTGSKSPGGSTPGAGFSRRKFLQGSGAAAAATAIATGEGLATANEQTGDEQKAAKVIQGTQKMVLNVNGKDYTVLAEPRTTLLDVLRYQFGLTGAKPISTDGSSGGSTVFLDGKPVSANTVLALQVKQKKVQTVESLGGKEPDAVPLAFVEHDAEQCGFCTPGFVMAVRAFLNKNPQATEAEIRSGLNGNICRCGTYANIIEACVAVVKGGSRG